MVSAPGVALGALTCGWTTWGSTSWPLRSSVRDTKDRNGPVLAFDAADWKAFLDTVR